MDTGVRYIKGVGQAREKLMAKLGIHTLRDLVTYFPRAYEDRTQKKTIGSLIIGETVCILAMAAGIPVLSHIRKGLDLVKLHAVDDTGGIDITFFNQSFVKDAIIPGEFYVFYGKISGTTQKPAMTNPLFEQITQAGVLTGRIMPVYSLTAGLTQKAVMNAVRAGLNECGDTLPDFLPESVLRQHELCRARFAYENIHFPADAKSLEIARRRLIFEEFFTLAAAMRFLRSQRAEKAGRTLKNHSLEEFYAGLPFIPTAAQKRAVDEAVRDMTTGKAMNRLVQGDVGSGKTLVAAALGETVWRNGAQTAFMAPTEILAAQHYETLCGLLAPSGMNIGLLTGSMTARKKREVYGRLEAGEIDLVIGTHALLSEGVAFRELALVVTDEQHRFGVRQRSRLTAKGDSPHVLVMSATPIPRTLALIIYGDLDVSVIDEMPPGRQKVDTFAVGESHRARVYRFIERLVSEGRQVFIVCPAVEEGESPDIGLKAARNYSEKLQKEVFPNLRIRLVHGKMPAREKERAMSEFAGGEADILVATTVVEVGVDVPNAALIVVENADRFGLSQLHQLRGRVGRGGHKSYCVLFKSSELKETNERLRVMETVYDGFKIAEEDLKLRGPGDFFGSRQHGLPEMRIARFASDMELLGKAQNAAAELLSSDPELKSFANRQLREQIKRMFEMNGGVTNA